MSHANIRGLALIVLLATACGVPAGAQSPGAGDGSKPADTTSTTETAEKTDFECPVTIPGKSGFEAPASKLVEYSKHFPPPEPFPHSYPHEGMQWYGTAELWTALDIEGDHGGRKSVWWSANFPGGIAEEQPEVEVTWTRLDSKEPVVIDNGGEATNAYTVEEGWFMIAGIDPDEVGCWEVEATYKGASLSYVYEMD